MRSKFALIATAALVSGFAWSWIVRDTPQVLPEAEDATEGARERLEQQAASKRELSRRRASPPNPSPERKAAEQEVARSLSPVRESEVPRERRESPRRAPAVDAEERSGGIDDDEIAPGSEEERSRGIDDGEIAPGSEEVTHIKELLEVLRNDSWQTPGGELDTTDLSPEDIDRLDLDEDREISDWEQEQALRLLERAENHPLKNDRNDRSYPVERENYRGRDSDFDAVDTNEDDVMDADEYHAFLVDAERLSVFLDTDGDRHISHEESGLSADDFAPLDRDDSGDLRPWEIRRAFALGAFD
ncbi:MAG: hypothetical protein JRG80_03525 [Deltaproteobacteria bacterium]|nr:hypothetical protein [Deltaproteobacteria bacterium]MBW2398326.1 hypothetical protein [Deltaproteobacteria bacterium]